ncbi:ANKRD32_3 [Blepharisma stoltei]|uniref:Uncharacterized protein n=1 Tax=Blepharisma stoltei TaxID=1481888 RepID=A0AAU9J6L5_9CILI|nr:unnamed protein product [Blepharisma stoltei]
MRRNLSCLEILKECKQSPSGRWSTELFPKKKLLRRSQLSFHAQTPNLWKTSVTPAATSRNLVASKAQFEINRIKANRENTKRDDESNIEDDSFEDKYDQAEGKFTSKFAGTFTIPRSKFQLASGPDWLPPVDRGKETSPTNIEELQLVTASSLKHAEYLQSFQQKKPQKRYMKSLKNSLREMKNLKLTADDIWRMDKIIPKEPYHKSGAKEFLQACKDGNEIKAMAMVAEDKHIIHVFDSMGMTGLHWACMRNFVNLARFLLENKAYINTADYFHRTPMHLAAKIGSERLINLLIEYKADPLKFSNGKKLPVHMTKNEAIKFRIRRYMMENYVHQLKKK